MQTAAIDQNEHLTTATVARELRVSEGTVRRLERAGELPAERTSSGMRLFRRSDVERLREERAARG